MLPALRALGDGAETPLSEVRSRIADAERLTTEDLRETLPSSRQPVSTNRVGWALLYLGRAGLSKRVRRGIWQLTAEGRELLADAPPRIDMNHLRNYPAYVAWRTGKDRCLNPDALAGALEQRTNRNCVIGAAHEKYGPLVAGKNTRHPDTFPHLVAKSAECFANPHHLAVVVGVFEHEDVDVAGARATSRLFPSRQDRRSGPGRRFRQYAGIQFRLPCHRLSLEARRRTFPPQCV